MELFSWVLRKIAIALLSKRLEVPEVDDRIFEKIRDQIPKTHCRNAYRVVRRAYTLRVDSDCREVLAPELVALGVGIVAK